MKIHTILAMAACCIPFQAMAQSVPKNDERPEQIADDAARDLKDNRFYNKPGATRAEYDRDWQECRLIARGSKTPTGYTSYYNPALYNPSISPLAGAVGGGIGALIGAAIVEGQQRRANRRSCLLIRGWRLVELPQKEAASIVAFTDAQRDVFFNSVIGANEVSGKITELKSFEPKFETSIPAADNVQFFIGKKTDPKMPVAISDEEAAVVVAFRRATNFGNSHAMMSFLRFDPEKGDLIFQPRDWKKKGDKTVYFANAISADKKALYELQIVRLTPGSYAIDFVGLGKMNFLGNTNCFGAPIFTVKAGEVAYVTDIMPVNMKKPDGKRVFELGMFRDAAAARSGLNKFQPALAERMSEVSLKNRGTYTCSGTAMTRMDFPAVTENWTAAPAKEKSAGGS